jgi:hypothetical protein
MDASKHDDNDRHVNKSGGSNASRDDNSYHMIPIDRARSDVEQTNDKFVDNEQSSVKTTVNNQKKDPRQSSAIIDEIKTSTIIDETTHLHATEAISNVNHTNTISTDNDV